MSTLGTLYLVPTHLSDVDAVHTPMLLPSGVIARACELNHYIAENAKTARAFLKAIGQTRPIASISIAELPKHGDAEALIESLLDPLLAGNDVGLVSEAGAPAVADPGARVVAAAHRRGIRVVPLVGPSALLLALMASGLSGQCFSFHGYLPTESAARRTSLAQLERDSKQRRCTQLLIETPYRNQALFTDMLSSLTASTRLCVAADVTGPNESIQTRSVSEWKQLAPTLARVPTMFLFMV